MSSSPPSRPSRSTHPRESSLTLNPKAPEFRPSQTWSSPIVSTPVSHIVATATVGEVFQGEESYTQVGHQKISATPNSATVHQRTKPDTSSASVAEASSQNSSLDTDLVRRAADKPITARELARLWAAPEKSPPSPKSSQVAISPDNYHALLASAGVGPEDIFAHGNHLASTLFSSAPLDPLATEKSDGFGSTLKFRGNTENTQPFESNIRFGSESSLRSRAPIPEQQQLIPPEYISQSANESSRDESIINPRRFRSEVRGPALEIARGEHTAAERPKSLYTAQGFPPPPRPAPRPEMNTMYRTPVRAPRAPRAMVDSGGSAHSAKERVVPGSADRRSSHKNSYTPRVKSLSNGPNPSAADKFPEDSPQRFRPDHLQGVDQYNDRHIAVRETIQRIPQGSVDQSEGLPKYLGEAVVRQSKPKRHNRTGSAAPPSFGLKVSSPGANVEDDIFSSKPAREVTETITREQLEDIEKQLEAFKQKLLKQIASKQQGGVPTDHQTTRTSIPAPTYASSVVRPPSMQQAPYPQSGLTAPSGEKLRQLPAQQTSSMFSHQLGQPQIPQLRARRHHLSDYQQSSSLMNEERASSAGLDVGSLRFQSVQESLADLVVAQQQQQRMQRSISSQYHQTAHGPLFVPSSTAYSGFSGFRNTQEQQMASGQSGFYSQQQKIHQPAPRRPNQHPALADNLTFDGYEHTTLTLTDDAVTNLPVSPTVSELWQEGMIDTESRSLTPDQKTGTRYGITEGGIGLSWHQNHPPWNPEPIPEGQAMRVRPRDHEGWGGWEWAMGKGWGDDRSGM